MILKGRHIFLIEDDPTNLAVIRMLLQRYGAHVPYDPWGDTTLNTLTVHANQLDCILLDIMLPNQVSGYDVYDAIQAVPELRGIPVVAVTASDPDYEMPKVRAKGLQGYIAKPIDRMKFPRQVLRAIQGESVWNE